MTEITPEVSRKLSLASFVSAVAVVLIHGPKTDNISCGLSGLLQWSYVEHVGIAAVPSFFCMSGFLLAGKFGGRQWLRDELAKRFRTLFVPYLFWIFVTYSVLSITNFISSGKTPAVMSVINSFGFNPLVSPQMPFWFIRNLLLFVVVSPVVCAVIQKGRGVSMFGLFLLYVIAAVSGVYVGAHPDSFGLFFRFLSFDSLFFFCLGCTLRLFPLELGVSWKKLFVVALLFIGFVIADCRLAAYFGYVPGAPVGTWLSMLKSVCLLYVGWNVIPSVELPRLFKGASFSIYLMHILLLLPIMILGTRFPLRPFGYYIHQNIISWWVSSLGVVVLASAIRIFWKWFSPRTASIVFGGR